MVHQPQYDRWKIGHRKLYGLEHCEPRNLPRILGTTRYQRCRTTRDEHPQNPAILSNVHSHDLTYNNVHIENFDVGIVADGKGKITIQGGYFKARLAINILEKASPYRTVQILGNPLFATLSSAQLAGRPQWDYYVSTVPRFIYQLEADLVDLSIIELNTLQHPNKILYSYLQTLKCGSLPVVGGLRDRSKGMARSDEPATMESVRSSLRRGYCTCRFGDHATYLRVCEIGLLVRQRSNSFSIPIKSPFLFSLLLATIQLFKRPVRSEYAVFSTRGNLVASLMA